MSGLTFSAVFQFVFLTQNYGGKKKS